MVDIIAVRRAEEYSPNSVDKDEAILRRVVEQLRGDKLEVLTVSEDDIDTAPEAGCYVSMARRVSTLQKLEAKAGRAVVVNAPKAVRTCSSRIRLNSEFKAQDVPVPAETGPDGCWVKADSYAQTADDVCYAATAAERDAALRRLRAKGDGQAITMAHVRGDIVKFYGVHGTDFFKIYYPTSQKPEDGKAATKFGLEQRYNGPARHYPLDTDKLRQTAERAAGAIGLDIYGGDCIVTPEGGIVIIDFNDWPSFSRCREDAAKAICTRIKSITRSRETGSRSRS